MAAPPSLLADREQAVHRARHRAPHEQEIPLGVHLHDPQAELGEAPRAHMAPHALALDDARRVGAGRDRARLAVARVAVRLRPAREVVAVHHALEAAPLRHARDLYSLARLEDRDGDRLARLGRLRSLTGQGEAVEHAGRDLEARPLHVAQQPARGALRLPRAEAELDPVPGDLHHGTGARLDHRHRHRRAFRVEDARHAELPADQSGHSLLHLDFDIHARRQIELRQRVDRLGARVHDVDQPLVGLQLELLAALLVDVRAAQHRPHLPLRGQRDGSRHLRARLLRRADDVRRGLVDERVVECFETNPDFARHRCLGSYFKIFVTTPAPTVPPPSRIAKRSCSSIAIGVISSIVIFVLSPALTTSPPPPLPPPRTSPPAPAVTSPRSTRPGAPAPGPVVQNTSHTATRICLPPSPFGTGMLLSSAVRSPSPFATPGFSPAIAFRAEPRITGMSSPGYTYFDNSSRTSSSTRSRSSASSTRSHLLRNTTIAGTFTCRANRMCSRVCGIGPSTADTTRIAPSIWAAPVIMVFT